ncbi:Ras GTPase-activating protein 1 [Phytophthora citrophthora]|uniref:Ras GTPase-activating protein 1 n=1 Tax=Phytophthora citrophthora TaxID=4793 RepID=A0AAD9H0W5_9STRA|nr:Ras GTPase-activating protein 1 [Phytophthora citrophthora]
MVHKASTKGASFWPPVLERQRVEDKPAERLCYSSNEALRVRQVTSARASARCLSRIAAAPQQTSTQSFSSTGDVRMPQRSSIFDPSGSRVPINEETETDVPARPELVKCPELLLTGLELEKRTTLRILHKKGRRFESPWEPFFVGVYAHSLFYYANLGEWPRGVVPLVNAEVKAVDRIFRHGDAVAGGDDCGPCWKVTSSSGRVLLFRAPSHDARVEWIEQLRQAADTRRKNSMDGKAALALARRLSRSSSSASSTSVSSIGMMQSPKQRRRKRMSEDESEHSNMLRDALHMVEKQRKEIEELQKRLEKFEGGATEKETTYNTPKQGDRERQGEEVVLQVMEAGGVEQGDEELNLDTMLDDAAIEICKVSRGSAISDVLSDDDDTPSSENEDNDDNEEEQAGMRVGKGERNENIQSLSLVDESTEPFLEQNAQDYQEEVEVESEDSNIDEAPAPPKQKPRQEAVSGAVSSTPEFAPSKLEPAPAMSPTSSLDASSASCYDATENESIQQQAAELAEMARNLNKDDPTDSSSTRESSEDGSLSSSFKGSHSGVGIFDSNGSSGNDLLQQQAMELAEIARNLQSSFRVDPIPAQAPLNTKSSSSSLLESQSSFSDVTDFGLNQINSNDSNDSIFSITQDDLFYDEDEEGEMERLSEFEASDSQFLEASGFLDSIHQVMKDFIVSSQPDQSRQPDQLVISDEIIAEIRQGIDTEPSKGVDELEEAHRQRSLQTDSPAADPSNGTSPRIRSLFSHARSARDFFNGDFERAPLSQVPKDLPSLVVEDTMLVVASILQSAGREDKMVLLAPFLRVFGSRNRLSHLIRWAIEIEVASVINVATLFRSDDYASRLVSTYSKAIGSKFIRVALSDPIRQIFKLKIADMELNPHKEESLQDENQADTNAANLMRTCQNIIDSIMKNTHCIPSSYFHICSHLNSKVISRFDGSKEGVEAEDESTLTRSVIGGFLFLRFVCPAITTPHLYGLTKQLPPPETRRVLVLVTKLLFKTATGVKFGDREPQFKVLNPFIEKNSPAIQQLFANLAMSPSQDIDECFAADSRKIYSNVSSSQLVEDVETIRSISEKNLEEIEKKLEDCDCEHEVAENFKTAVLYNTDSFQKSSLTKKLSANMKFLSGFGKKPRSRKQSDQ